MAPQIVDRCYLTIDGVEVLCASIDKDIDPSAQVVEAMTKDNLPIGYAYGNPKIRLTAETALDASSDGIDFEEMSLSKQEFTSSIEYEGGTSKTYVRCIIMKATERARTGQHVSWNLDIHALGLVKN